MMDTEEGDKCSVFASKCQGLREVFFCWDHKNDFGSVRQSKQRMNSEEDLMMWRHWTTKGCVDIGLHFGEGAE